MIKDTGK